MKKYKTIVFSCIASVGLALSSCDSYVEDIEPLRNDVRGGDLNTETDIDLLLTGLLNRASDSGDSGQGFGKMLWRAAGYSDEFIHGAIWPGAPDHVSFVQDGPADVRFNEADWENYHAIHYLADKLVERVGEVDAADGFADQTIRSRALFYGYLYGGLSRMYLADHWGEGTGGTNPGATFTTEEQALAGEFGPFLTSAELHEAAREKFMLAAANDPGDVPNHDRVAWSFIARTYLFDGMYEEARAAAVNGLQQGDEAFGTLQSILSPNQFWFQSGRTNDTNIFLFSPHPRFIQYVLDDRAEGEIISELTQEDLDNGVVSYSLRGIESGEGEPGNRNTVDPRASLANQNERLPLWEERVRTSVGAISEDNTRWSAFRTSDPNENPIALATQDFYTSLEDKFELIDWREMELILAEVAIREGDLATAVTHINNVRAFHGLEAATVANLTNYNNPNGGASITGIFLGNDSDLPEQPEISNELGYLLEERDKTLWMKGTRLPDQKRFNLWHKNSQYRFYIAIPRTETFVNPNVSN